MEQRLIDANALCERLAARALEYSDLDECTENTIKEDMHIVHTMPTIDTQPVVPGHWISFLDGDSIMPERFYKCSRCGRVERRKEPYCHCGAQMDGGDGNGGADSED